MKIDASGHVLTVRLLWEPLLVVRHAARGLLGIHIPVCIQIAPGCNI
jgi:hypothetical protein